MSTNQLGFILVALLVSSPALAQGKAAPPDVQVKVTCVQASGVRTGAQPEQVDGSLKKLERVLARTHFDRFAAGGERNLKLRWDEETNVRCGDGRMALKVSRVASKSNRLQIEALIYKHEKETTACMDASVKCSPRQPLKLSCDEPKATAAELFFVSAQPLP
ncbi:MAG: hypothetical protein AAF533_27220 [Acidobacteriota bacterium]